MCFEYELVLSVAELVTSVVTKRGDNKTLQPLSSL